jgi:hypothetical protein
MFNTILEATKQAFSPVNATQTSVMVREAGTAPHRGEVRRNLRETRKTELTEFVQKHNLQFAYLRNYSDPVYGPYGHVQSGNEVLPNGGMVIAYSVPIGANIVEVSTSLCNDKDSFDKLIGKHMAAKNFDEGKKITVRLGRSSHYSQQLADMFAIRT